MLVSLLQRSSYTVYIMLKLFSLAIVFSPNYVEIWWGQSDFCDAICFLKLNRVGEMYACLRPALFLL